jgi:hypothetical protein
MDNDTDNNKIKAFSELLDSLNVTDKKKELWKEIYGHAIQDRSYALQMYVNCSNVVIADPTQHAIHGPNIAKYLERMSRSNDQLLKLAELVASAEEASGEGFSMTPDEIYEKLSEAGPAVVPIDKNKKKGR